MSPLFYRLRRRLRRVIDFITGAATRREIERLERVIQRLLDENWTQHTRLNMIEAEMKVLQTKQTRRRKS